MMKKYTTPIRKPAENRGVDPVIKWVWHEMQAQRITQQEMARRSGFSSGALRNWFQGRSSPNYANVRALVNVLGYHFKLEKAA